MGYKVPKELKGEERWFKVPYTTIPVYKKNLIYNGPATLISSLIGKISGNLYLFAASFVILNVLVYPLGSSKVEKKEFDNGYMDRDKLAIRKLLWKFNGGGNIYISHKRGLDR